jgi:hypothetical protein
MKQKNFRKEFHFHREDLWEAMKLEFSGELGVQIIPIEDTNMN